MDEFYYKKSKFEIPYHIVTKIRFIFLSLYLLDEVFGYYYRYNLWEFLQVRSIYLTEWGYFLTGIYFALTALLAIDYTHTTMLSNFFAIVLTSECIITLVYWPIIHSKALLMFPDRPQLIFILYTRHSAPLIFLLIDLAINKIIITAHSIKSMILFTYVYLTWNFIVTKYRNKPVYDVLDFKGFFSVFFVLAIFVFIIVFWRLALYVSDKKYHRISKLKI